MSRPSHPPLPLKQNLMELGNRLVTEHGFNPSAGTAVGPIHEEMLRSTDVITLFTRWLNEVPEAREILLDMGYQWPVYPVTE